MENRMVNRIRKLLDLHRNSPDDHEAAVAAAKARRLMRQLAGIPENTHGRIQSEIVDHTVAVLRSSGKTISLKRAPAVERFLAEGSAPRVTQIGGPWMVRTDLD